MGNREAIAQMRRDHPDWTLQTIADQFGCTRETIRQELNKAGEPTRAVREPKHQCQHCGEPSRVPRNICRPCRYIISSRYVNCFLCGKSKCIRKWQYNARVSGYETLPGRKYTGRFFCDRVCFWRWIGLTHKPAPHKVDKGNPPSVP